MANVLSFKQVFEIPGVKVITYTSKENTLTVRLKNWMEIKFKCNDGLYYYDTKINYNSKLKVNNYGVNILNTVARKAKCNISNLIFILISRFYTSRYGHNMV